MKAFSKIVVTTCVFKRKIIIPPNVLTKPNLIAKHIKDWLSQKFNLMTEEIALFSNDKRVPDMLLIRNIGNLFRDKNVNQEWLDMDTTLHLTMKRRRQPVTECSTILVCVHDTTKDNSPIHQLTMHPFETISKVKQKLATCCDIPVFLQLIRCRGRVVTDEYPLCEYLVSTLKNPEFVFYLSKDPSKLNDEMLALIINAPSINSKINIQLRAGEHVKKLLDILNRYYKMPSTYTVANAVGRILTDELTIRQACTIPFNTPSTDFARCGTVNMAFFCVPMSRKEVLAQQPSTAVASYIDPRLFKIFGIPTQKKQIKSSRPQTGQSSLFKGIFTKKHKCVKTTANASPVFKTPKESQHDDNEASPINKSGKAVNSSKKIKSKKKKKKPSYKQMMRKMKKSLTTKRQRQEKYQEKIHQSVGNGKFDKLSDKL